MCERAVEAKWDDMEIIYMQKIDDVIAAGFHQEGADHEMHYLSVCLKRFNDIL